MKKLLIVLLLSIAGSCWAQASYIPEQIGRETHHIIQSLGAFVGNERAESQAFDITFMPGREAEGVMVVNTADYRCTFRLDPQQDICFMIKLDIRSADFLREFEMLFETYKTDTEENIRMMNFGDKILKVEEEPSRTSRFKSFTITEASRR